MNRVKFPFVDGRFGDGSYVKYAYDKTSQLLSERMFLANDTEFLKQEIPPLGGYDDAGNRLQYNITDHGIEKQIASAYDEANQLNARNVRFPSIPNQSWQTTYTNDLRGNRTQKVQPAGAGLEAEQWDYTFNIFNKLTKVEITKLGVKTEFGFKYGADGYRVEKFWGTVESPTDARKFIMDGVHVILEKDAEGETKVRYIPGVCMITRDYNNQPVIRYYLQDALGSNVAMTDEEQNITALYQSDAWGNELLATEDIPNPYRWNGASGYYRDNDAQLYLLGMRWYDAETGRFVSRDPIGFEGGDLNLVRYVGNRPTRRNDPIGLNGEAEMLEKLRTLIERGKLAEDLRQALGEHKEALKQRKSPPQGAKQVFTLAGIVQEVTSGVLTGLGAFLDACGSVLGGAAQRAAAAKGDEKAKACANLDDAFGKCLIQFDMIVASGGSESPLQSAMGVAVMGLGEKVARRVQKAGGCL